jgi:membrane fusion protein (multidrug efflux system)
MLMPSTVRGYVHIAGLVLLLGGLGAVTSACGRTEAETAVSTEQKVPVRTAVVTARDLTETLTLTGTLDARAKVRVVSEVSARLLRVLKTEGDRVAQGTVIAVLDDTDFRLARDRAKALLDVADANRSHAQAEEERAASLLKTGGITDKERLAAQVSVQVAEASAAQARTELAIAEQQVARTQVKAPISGRVSRKSADAGSMLAVGTPIFEIVDDSAFEFRAAVASADFAKVRVGEAVTVTVDALPGFSTRGQVDRIVPLVEARSRAFDVIVRVPGQSQLVSGLFARAEVSVRDVPGSLTVPPTALVRDGADPGRAQAFVVTGGKAERRDVTVGVERTDAIQVTSGLQAGEAVVLDPPASLGPGTPVEIQTTPQAGS